MQSNLWDLITIDRRSKTPYDFQIKESIKALILDQTFIYKAVLPDSDFLASKLNIDKKYINSAYEQLIFERYVKKTTTNGYQVSFFELTNYFFERNVAVYDAISDLGMHPSIQCIEKKLVTLSKAEIETMGFDSKKSDKYMYINRIYKGDDKPIMVLENYLPLYMFPNIFEKFRGDEPLNDFLDKFYDNRAAVSRRITKAVNLNQELAKLLNERNNAASLRSTNRVYNRERQLIDYGQSHTISSYYFQSLIDEQEIINFSKEIDRN